MSSSSYIELNINDDLVSVIRKCNANFKSLGTQKQQQDRINSRSLEDEERERKKQDGLLDDRITEVEEEIPKVFYGTCNTISTTQTKVIDCPNFTSEDLVAGCLLYCRFTYEQGYNGAPNLNVNSTGSHQVSRVSTEALPLYWWEAKEMVAFVYEGTRWLVLRGGEASTTNWGNTKLLTAIDSNIETKAATPKSVKQAYDNSARATYTEKLHRDCTDESNFIGMQVDITDYYEIVVSDLVDQRYFIKPLLPTADWVTYTLTGGHQFRVKLEDSNMRISLGTGADWYVYAR